MITQPDLTKGFAVRLPGWRLHLSHMLRRKEREMGKVMDTATRGALAHLRRCFPERRVEPSGEVAKLRRSLTRAGLDPARTPPSSELLIARLLEAPELARGNLPWEFLCILTAKSLAPWSVLDRGELKPPLVFRAGERGERLAQPPDGELDCEGLPVLADRGGVVGSPWTLAAPRELEGCEEPVFVCYLPEDLFRRVDPKSHMGRAVWITWAYQFIQQRTRSFRPAPA